MRSITLYLSLVDIGDNVSNKFGGEDIKKKKDKVVSKTIRFIVCLQDG